MVTHDNSRGYNGYIGYGLNDLEVKLFNGYRD
jgi:hypothetical protein